MPLLVRMCTGIPGEAYTLALSISPRLLLALLLAAAAQPLLPVAVEATAVWASSMGAQPSLRAGITGAGLLATLRAFLAARRVVRAVALVEVFLIVPGVVWALASASRNTDNARVRMERSMAEGKRSYEE